MSSLTCLHTQTQLNVCRISQFFVSPFFPSKHTPQISLIVPYTLKLKSGLLCYSVINELCAFNRDKQLFIYIYLHTHFKRQAKPKQILISSSPGSCYIKSSLRGDNLQMTGKHLDRFLQIQILV